MVELLYFHITFKCQHIFCKCECAKKRTQTIEYCTEQLSLGVTFTFSFVKVKQHNQYVFKEQFFNQLLLSTQHYFERIS